MKKTADFKIGDVVRMVSGGPNMVIYAIRIKEDTKPHDKYLCAWFKTNNELCTESFGDFMLELVEDNKEEEL